MLGSVLASVWKNAASRKHRSQAQKFFVRRATESLGHHLEQPCVGFLLHVFARSHSTSWLETELFLAQQRHAPMQLAS
eukprot:5349109-Amphidinium_carterae.1